MFATSIRLHFTALFAAGWRNGVVAFFQCKPVYFKCFGYADAVWVLGFG